MDVREKLVELIRCADYHPCKGAVRTIGSMFTTDFIEDIASHLIVHGVTVQEWISVKDRLPGEEGLYLVAVVNDHERRYSKTAWYHGRENWFSNQKVTHWMPLPQPPKGE